MLLVQMRPVWAPVFVGWLTKEENSKMAHQAWCLSLRRVLRQLETDAWGMASCRQGYSFDVFVWELWR